MGALDCAGGQAGQTTYVALMGPASNRQSRLKGSQHNLVCPLRTMRFWCQKGQRMLPPRPFGPFRGNLIAAGFGKAGWFGGKTPFFLIADFDRRSAVTVCLSLVDKAGSSPVATQGVHAVP